MLLSKLISELSYVRIVNFVDREIINMTHDSTQENINGIFCAIKGANVDGHKKCEESIKNGSVCVLCEHEIKNIKVVQVIVPDVRKAMSILAKKMSDNACDKLHIIGVTGTNGKTTTVNLIASVLREAGYRVATIGTMGAVIDDEIINTGFTTPDPIILHSTFAYMVEKGVEYVVMEISAHAIALRKMEGVVIDSMVLTNITPEHLDFFKTMENYAKVKLDYVFSDNVKRTIVNIDDDIIRADARVLSDTILIGLDNPSDVFAVNIVENDGMNFVVNACDKLIEIRTDLIGRYNIYNIMSAIAVCVDMGINAMDIANGICNATSVAGRMEVYRVGEKTIVVDFAHTPDGFTQSLSTIKSHFGNNITTIFGCVWYSDEEKRKLMGKCASAYSKKIIITTDNIGDADFDKIANDIRKGINDSVEVVEIEDRADAIKRAYENMQDGEVLAVLGKGGEHVQKIKGKQIDYDESEVVKSIINNKE